MEGLMLLLMGLKCLKLNNKYILLNKLSNIYKVIKLFGEIK